MSTFSYNGIDLKMVQLLNYRRRIKFDSCGSYMWSEHLLTVQGVYDPKATCYSLENNDPANVRKDDGRNPSFTDLNIRHQLAQPRGRLVFTAAGTDLIGNPSLFVDGLANDDLTILESPPPGEEGLHTGQSGSFVTDCNNGPLVLAQQVTRITGTRSWHVSITVQASVNESYRFYSSPAVLLSHVWSASEDIDRDGWSTRTIRGQATFRTDRLTQLQAKVDDYREALGHPVPDNCQRYGIQVNVAEPGNRLTYVFTDKHMSHNILLPNITWIEATGSMQQGRIGREEEVFGAVNIAAHYAAASADIAAGTYTFNATGLLSRGILAAARIPQAIGNLMPTSRFRIDIRVWGNRQATRLELAQAALKVLQAKAPAVATGGIPPAQNINLTVDLAGRFVALSVEYVLGGYTTAWNLSGALPVFNPADPGQFQQTGDKLLAQLPEYFDMEIPGVASVKDTPGRSATPEKLTRGSWLGALVAQALSSSNQLPGKPPLAPLAQDLSLSEPS
jgi:hypothetical protein